MILSSDTAGRRSELEAGSVVLQILERIDQEVRIGVAGKFVESLAVGQRHEVNIRTEQISGTLKSILPIRESRTRSVDVILMLDAELDGIRRGDLARLSLERERKEMGSGCL